MADYMSKQHPDYIFLPSSCKQSTPDIEFVMYDRKKGTKITCQTKVDNERIDVRAYTSFENMYEKIYIFSGAGYKPRNYEDILQQHRHIICVDRNELFNTLSENPIYRPLVEQFFDVIWNG